MASTAAPKDDTVKFNKGSKALEGSKMSKDEFQKGAAQGSSDTELKEITDLYTKLAIKPDHDFGWGTGPENAKKYGYKAEWIAEFPKEVFESNAAGGCPFSLGEITKGATVVDFGCGAGADLCIAAKMVGPTGKVFGIDVTPAMLEKARKNVELCGFKDRVEFIQCSPEWPNLSGGTRKGKSHPVQIPKGSVDFVISNNVVNLIAAKLWVYVEARVLLKPGGRLQMVDVVRDEKAEKANPGYSATVDGTLADWVTGTVAPAVQMADMRKAGFVNVESHGSTGYRTSPVTVSMLFSAAKPMPKPTGAE